MAGNSIGSGNGRHPRPKDIRGAPDALDGALMLKLDERLTPRDLAVLQKCWDKADLDELTTNPHQIVWLLAFRLVATWIDREDRIWIETTHLGRDLTRHVLSRRKKAKAAPQKQAAP